MLYINGNQHMLVDFLKTTSNTKCIANHQEGCFKESKEEVHLLLEKFEIKLRRVNKYQLT